MNSLCEAIITAKEQRSRSDNDNKKLEQKITVTLDNVHKFTTFTLRQELEKRNVTFESSDIINHNILLQKMIQILYNEQQRRQDETVTNDHMCTISCSSLVSETIQERLHQEKMERKREAIERSKQRQLNKEYFQNKKIANERQWDEGIQS